MVKPQLIYIYSYQWKLENSSNFRNFYLPHFAAKYVVADVISEMMIWFLSHNLNVQKCAKLARNFILPCRTTPVTYNHSFSYVSLYAL
jgi:hypothetical protein